MSAATLARDLVVAQTRGVEMPGVARTFEPSRVKRAMRTGRTKTISTRSSAPSRPRATSPVIRQRLREARFPR